MDDNTTTTLYIEEKSFVFRYGDNFISIEKDIFKQTGASSNSYNQNKPGLRIQGILGFIEGKQTNYLVVINRSTYIGFIHKSKFYKIQEIKLISFVGDGSLKTTEDHKYEKMLTDFLKRNSLYYSDSYDLSNSISKMFTTKKLDSNSPFSNINSNYCWNYKIGKILDLELMKGILISVINGSIGIKVVCYSQDEVDKNTKEFCFALISRKDTRRSGMRFLVRGSDSNGSVANFVETEQIFLNEEQNKTNLVSYNQIRGSIPLSWKQEPDLNLNPEVI
jgi:hypothetical protein